MATASFGFGALALVPRPDVEAGQPIDPRDPFTAPFTLSNNNVVPLNSVRVGMGICRISNDYFDTNKTCNGRLKSILLLHNWQHAHMSADEKATFTISEMFDLHGYTPQITADISIVVIYRPWFLPFDMRKQLKFYTKYGPNGYSTWYSRPLSD